MPRKLSSRVTRSPEVIDRIIAAVSGGTPLAEVLRERWAPHHSSFYQWLNDDPELDSRFEEARRAGHDLIAANIRKIARGKEGSTKDVKRDRLIVDTDLKLLEKWDRRYRQAQILAGDPDAPLIPPAPTIDKGETLAAILGVALARRALAERDGMTLPLSREQYEYLERMHPTPAPVPLVPHRDGWQPGPLPGARIIEAKPIDEHDGSDLA